MKIDWKYLVISVAIVLLGVGMFFFAHFFVIYLLMIHIVGIMEFIMEYAFSLTG